MRSVGLVGVTALLGLQQVRNLLTGLTFYLVGALDAPVGAVVAGTVAVLLFGAVFLTPLLLRRFGSRNVLWSTVLGAGG